MEAELGSKLLQERQVTGAILSKRPFLADANFAQRPRRRDQLPNEILRRGRSQFAIKFEHEQMRHSQFANKRDLVLRRGQEPRTFLRPENLCRVRIKRNHDGRATRFDRVPRGSGDDRLMSKVDTIKDTDGEKNRAWDLRQLRDRPQDLHASSSV